MKRLVIAIDCDDVLVLTTPYFVAAYNKTYGTNGTLLDAPDVYSPVWNADPDTIVQRWADLMETAEYKMLEPDDQEVSILRRLAKDHELHLVTARQEAERSFTVEMLDRKLSGIFTSLEFVGWGGSKGEVCRRIGADLLIDDSYRNLQDAMRHGMPSAGTVLFGTLPATLAYKDKADSVYCRDWGEVDAYIASLAGA